MPCYDPRDDVNSKHYEPPKSTELEEKNKVLKKRLDEVTQNLCYVCGELTRADELETYASARTCKWWYEHKDADEERVSKKMYKFLKDNVNVYNPKEITKKFIDEAEKVHPVSTFHKEWFEKLATGIRSAVNIEYESERELQKIRYEALKKLTTEEKVILGIN